MTVSNNRSGVPGTRLALAAAALGALLQAPLHAGPKRCDWHGPSSGGEIPFNKCIDYASLQSQKTLNLPANVTRISQDGISFCKDAINTTATLDADIVYMMDNSGSMERGENLNGVQTKPGDPNGIRDRVIRRAMRQQRASTNVSTAGFLSFVGLSAGTDPTRQHVLGPEADKLQHPLEIDRTGDPNETNLKRLLSKVWKHDPKEAALAKTTATEKIALTYWSEALSLAVGWFSPDSGYVKTKQHAIILVSDGAISDWNQVLAMVGDKKNPIPPVFGIHLGDSSEGKHLKDLATLTGGKFYVVDPTDTGTFYKVMQNIVGFITHNPVPAGVQVTNSSVAPPQVSRSTGVAVNPDGSMGIALDSIIGLQSGENHIQIQVTRDDGSKQDFAFTLNVAGAALGGTGGNYTCYDQATLTPLDASGDSLKIYAPERTTYDVKLTRSPSDVDGTTVGSSSDNGDKENIQVPKGNGIEGFITQKGKITIVPNSGANSGDGVVQAENHGTITLTWSHPRDPRETATYILPGRLVPTVDGTPHIKIDTAVVVGTPVDLPTSTTVPPIVVIDDRGVCVMNCVESGNLIDNRNGIPSWTLTIRGPLTYTMTMFDHLGQFVNSASGDMSQADYDKLHKSGDSVVVKMLMRPFSKQGQQMGTGAYLMRMRIQGAGDKMVTNSQGEPILLKSSTKEYFKRFGYIRPKR